MTLFQKSLDHIGRRGNVGGSIRSERINHAYDILAKETLPHISIERSGFKQKAYFFGYMVHRLVLAKLNRRELDDRDHFGKKRLDLAGPLLANLFRQLYRKFTRDIYRNLQKVGLPHAGGVRRRMLICHKLFSVLIKVECSTSSPPSTRPSSLKG